MRERQKYYKKIKKIAIMVNCLLLIILIFSQMNISNTKASENYSNYIYNQPISIYSDRAMILNEQAESSNNYRNYFDSGFIFPAKLSNQMFNAYATSYSQYSLSN